MYFLKSKLIIIQYEKNKKNLAEFIIKKFRLPKLFKLKYNKECSE